MPTQITITNGQLIKMLKESYLDLEQKINLIPLIHLMNEEERAGLFDLIKQAEQIQHNKSNSGPKYQEGLRKLNEEYSHKMDQLVKDETSHARQEFETLSGKQDAGALSALEEEIKNI